MVVTATLLALMLVFGSPCHARAARDSCLEEKWSIRREMEVTAYTAGPESTGKHPGHPLYGVTASGERVRQGVVAASRSLPFGARVYVPGYGYGIVLDRGGAIVGDRLDVYFDDVGEALRWGRQKLPVVIFVRDPGNVGPEVK